MFCLPLRVFAVWLSLLPLWLGMAAHAQYLPVFYQHEQLAMDARLLFTQGQYAPAFEKYEQLIRRLPNHTQMEQPQQRALLAEIYYRRALCSFYLLRNDTEALFDDYIRRFPGHNYVPNAHFYMANLRFIYRQYNKVPERLSPELLEQLTPDLAQEARFMLGFSYLDQDSYAEAETQLTPLSEVTGPWHDRANYYLGIAHYKQGRYAPAFKAFQAVEQSREFRLKVPLYIASCLVALEQYPLAVDYAQQLAKQDTSFDQQDLLYMQLGTAFYELGRYADALPYLTYYRENVEGKPDRSAVFRLAFSHYRNEAYTEAVNYFGQVVQGEDTLSQASALYKAFCQLALDKPEEARQSLKRAYDLNIDDMFTKEAHFQYAKASLLLNYFEIAHNLLMEYSTQYGLEDVHAEEVQELLGEVFFYTQRFDEAIIYFEKIPLQNDRARTAYQKACYYEALRLIKEKQTEAAANLLQKAIITDAELLYTQNARFWKGELLFFQRKYGAAGEQYQSFLSAAGAEGHPYYMQTLLGKGWSLMRQAEYAQAEKQFARMQQLPNIAQEHPQLYSEALVRRGDCFFIQKKYKDAKFLYAQAIDIRQGRPDYARFQHAISTSRLGDHTSAIARMDELINRYPNSPIRAEAMLAQSDMHLRWENNYKQAAEYARRLLVEYPASNFAPMAHINLALAANQHSQTDTAIYHYRAVVLQFGNEEKPVQTAFDELKTLLEPAEMDTLLATYRQKYPGSKPFLDEVTFAQARDLFLIYQDAAGAVSRLTEFLEEYPNSVNLPEALLLRGQAYAANKEPEAALADFELLISRKKVDKDLHLRAKTQAAALYYTQKQYARSLEMYGILEKESSSRIDSLQAQMGMARAQLALGDSSRASKTYARIFSDPKVPEFTKARSGLSLARLLMHAGDSTEAGRVLDVVASLPMSSTAAEAMFYKLELMLAAEEYAALRDTVFALKDRFPNQGAWRAKAFVRLGQAYWEMGEFAQALETLRSVADNAQEEDTRAWAAELLAEKQPLYDAEQARKEIERIEAEDRARKDAQDAFEREPVKELDPDDPRLQENK